MGCLFVICEKKKKKKETEDIDKTNRNKIYIDNEKTTPEKKYI